MHDVQSALDRKTHAKWQALAAFLSVWQAGGESSARILLALLNTTLVLDTSAVGMRGGRVQKHYKHIGDHRNESTQVNSGSGPTWGNACVLPEV